MNKKEFTAFIDTIIWAETPEQQKKLINKLHKNTAAKNCNLQSITKSYSLNLNKQKLLKKFGGKVVSFENTGIGTIIKCQDANGTWHDITDYNCW